MKHRNHIFAIAMVLLYFKLINPTHIVNNNARFKSSQAFRLQLSNKLSPLECIKHKNIDSEVTIHYFASEEDNFEITELQIEPCCESFEKIILAELGFDAEGNKIR